MKQIYYYDKALGVRIKTTMDEVEKVLKRCNDRIYNLQEDVTHNDIVRLFDRRIDIMHGEAYTKGYPGTKLIAEYENNDFGDTFVKFVAVPDEEYDN